MNFFRRHNAARPEPPDLAGIEAVWFDLDGTLVQVDMQVFVPAYLQRLSARLAALADPRTTARILREAVMQILLTPAGEQTLEELLLDSLQERLGIHPDQYRQGLAAFCREDLAELSPLVKAHLRTRELLEACLARGWRLVLATNPIFPRAVIEARLAWGGLADLPFEIITSYETARCCKPHLAYFQGLLDALELPPDACLMVGNDTQHDLAASRAGVPTCLLTTWRIERPGERFAANWEGDHEDFLSLLRTGLPGAVYNDSTD